MTDVTENLADLVKRRLRELGEQRRREGSLSIREVWLPYEDQVSYETVRRVEQGTHTNLRPETADVLALMLDVPVSVIEQAAGRRPRLGAFKVPRRAERLTDSERRAVLAIIDAILNAKGGGEGARDAPTIATAPEATPPTGDQDHDAGTDSPADDPDRPPGPSEPERAGRHDRPLRTIKTAGRRRAPDRPT